jgi:MFS family permease
MKINQTEVKTVILTFLLWSFSGFDLILVTLLSVQVQKIYFPNIDQTISLIAVYGTLSLSLLARVFGGLYFSRLADIHGRKPIVLLCLIALSLTMFISAYLPNIYNYSDILKATTLVPLLFILTRITIGFFVGGIWPTAAIMGLETITKKRDDNTNIDEFNGETEFNNKWDKYQQNIQAIRESYKGFAKETKTLTGKSASMQIGFFTGYFVAALLFYSSFQNTFHDFVHNIFTTIACPHAQTTRCLVDAIFPDYNHFGPLGSMSLAGSVFGFVLFILYRAYTSESDYWKNSKLVFKQQEEILKDLKKQKMKEDMKNDKLINQNIKLVEKERLEPGILALLNNEEHREKVIGFWLILSGLMYMYYSTVVVLPEILTRDNVSLDNIISFSTKYPHIIVTLILLSTALIAHGIVGLVLYKRWDKNKKSTIKKVIFCLFSASEYAKICVNHKFLKYVLDVANDSTIEKNSRDKPKEHDLDIVLVVVIGFLLVIIGIINSLIFWITFHDNNSIYVSKVLIPLAILATLLANSGWGLVPSMLASRFPTHFRSTGSSLSYNGGLAVSFASPFIIMEFYLSTKSEYVIFVAMILGAISMIIGAKRLMHQKIHNL